MFDNSKSYWHNFVTGETMYVDNPKTYDEAKEYIPQENAVQDMFKLLVEHSTFTIDEAMIYVLSRVIGEEPPQKPTWQKPIWK